jgi:hypothetical protein
MSKKTVKEKGTNNDTIPSWEGALADAEQQLVNAQRQIMEWKAVVRICRERIKRGVPWPGNLATRN